MAVKQSAFLDSRGVNPSRFLPCPLCLSKLDVRESKKQKPYVVCDRCGVQLFVRLPDGIRKFDELIKRGDKLDVWAKLTEMQKRYRKICPSCESEFWVSDKLIATSWLDGEFTGYKCPEKNCKGIVKVDSKN